MKAAAPTDDQDVRAEARGVLADLALDPDDAGEHGGDQNAYDDVPDAHAPILGGVPSRGQAVASLFLACPV